MNENKLNIGYNADLQVGKTGLSNIANFFLTNAVTVGQYLIIGFLALFAVQAIFEKSDKTGFFIQKAVPLLILYVILDILSGGAVWITLASIGSQVGGVVSKIKF